jgi:chromosome segregation ATPase
MAYTTRQLLEETVSRLTNARNNIRPEIHQLRQQLRAGQQTLNQKERKLAKIEASLKSLHQIMSYLPDD